MRMTTAGAVLRGNARANCDGKCAAPGQRRITPHSQGQPRVIKGMRAQSRHLMPRSSPGLRVLRRICTAVRGGQCEFQPASVVPIGLITGGAGSGVRYPRIALAFIAYRSGPLQAHWHSAQQEVSVSIPHQQARFLPGPGALDSDDDPVQAP